MASNAPTVVDRVASAAESATLEGLTRPLLGILQEITGLESTYLTRVHWDLDEQEILYSANAGSIVIPEGLRIEWSDTLCRRALEEGSSCTDDVPAVWGDSRAARELGIQTYLSHPVRLADGEVYGTLCGASGARRPIDDDQARLLSMFAGLIAFQVERERARERERSRAEAAEERLKARASLLAMAQHELKSPLTVVLGCAEVLGTGKIPEAMQATLATALGRAGERLRAQIDRMIEEARAEVTAREIVLQRLDLDAEIGRHVREMEAAIGSHRIAYEGVGPVWAHADVSAMYQIVSHLVENAIKYAPAGSTIRVAVRERDGHAEIGVTDEGPGLPDDIDIFLPFTQRSSSRGGVGLGLHIVRSLAAAMDGTVQARNRDDAQGSAFEVHLPLRPDAA